MSCADDQPSDALLRDNAHILYSALLAQKLADELFEAYCETTVIPLNELSALLDRMTLAKMAALKLRDAVLRKVRGEA